MYIVYTIIVVYNIIVVSGTEVTLETTDEAAVTVPLGTVSTKHTPQLTPKTPLPPSTHHNTPTSLGSGVVKKRSGSSKRKTVAAPYDSELSPLVTSQMSPSSLPRSPEENITSFYQETSDTQKDSELMLKSQESSLQAEQSISETIV